MEGHTQGQFLSLVKEIAAKKCLTDLLAALENEGVQCIITAHDDIDSLAYLDLGMALEEKIEEEYPGVTLQEVVWDAFCETKMRVIDLYQLMTGEVKIAAFV